MGTARNIAPTVTRREGHHSDGDGKEHCSDGYEEGTVDHGCHSEFGIGTFGMPFRGRKDIEDVFSGEKGDAFPSDEDKDRHDGEESDVGDSRKDPGTDPSSDAPELVFPFGQQKRRFRHGGLGCVVALSSL